MAQKKITDLTLRSDFDTTCNIPVDDSTQTYRVTGAQILTFLKSIASRSDEIVNLSLVTSVAASALTVAVKTKAAGNASATDPINVSFRSSTLTSGAYVNRQITAALSLVISSGSTLGQIDAQPSLIYVYLIDNAGTPELAASHAYYPEDALVSTTAEGGAGAADSATAIYSTTARSSVACRLIGTILNTQTTAGTWASAGTKVQLLPAQGDKNVIVTRYTSGSSTHYTAPGCKKMTVICSAAGGGGGPGGSSSAAGGAGGTSSFGTALISCTGGSGGSMAGGYIAGGAPTCNSPAQAILSLTGGSGGAGSPYMINGQTAPSGGGTGGSNPLGGFGQAGGYSPSVGQAAISNTGGGGGGAGFPSGASGQLYGSGGGAGAYVSAVIPFASLLASYAVVVGAAGTAGTGGSAGGAGGSGFVCVIEEI